MTTKPAGVGVTPTPLVAITFLDGQHHIRRDWYHVPRIGDQVFLSGGEATDNLTSMYGLPPGVIAGTVRGVKWDSDGSVEVYVR